jgi:hypothetical protein
MIASMGWLKHILLGDIGQSMAIEENSEALAKQAAFQSLQSKRASEANLEIARLKRRNEQLNLAVTSLSRYLIKKGVIDPAEFSSFIDQLDASDGKLDGSLASEKEVAKPVPVTGKQPWTLRFDS